MTKDITKYIGWYDSPSQTEPSHNPTCGFCMQCDTLVGHPMRTVSIMYLKHPNRSYFYRVHRACADATDNDDKAFALIDEWDMERKNAQA